MKHTFEKLKLDQEARAKEKKEKRAWNIFAGILLVSQAVASGYVFYRAYTLGMIPGKLLFIFGGLLIVLLFFNYLLYFAGTKKSVARTFRRFIAILLTAAICGCSLYTGNIMHSVDKTVDKITVTDKETVAATMDVYVLSRDTATSLADCKDYVFGVVGGSQGPASFAAITKIGSEIGGQVKDSSFNSLTSLADALYQNQIQVAIIDQNYTGILMETDDYSDFEEKAKLLTTINVSFDELNAAKETNPYKVIAAEHPVDIDPATDKVAYVDQQPFIVYISGSDTRDTMFKVSRSDVNILMVVNPQTKQILLLNTPRDFYIPNPRSSSGAKDKLTHLGIYGVDCSITGLEKLYGCDINYYIQINFTGTETLIDDLGGITIDNPKGFSARGYNFPQGEITLNGPQAVVYARERYAFTEGDNMRGQNQMRLIKAIIKKLTSSSTFLILNYKTMLADLEGFIVTDLDSEEIDSLVKMQLNDLADWNVKSFAVTGEGGYDTTYSMPGQNLYVTYPDSSSVKRAQDLINKVYRGEILTDADVEP